MPLINQSMETTLDVSDSLKIKSDLSLISSAISTVYGEGQGSRQTVNIHATNSFKVDVNGNSISSNIRLADKNKLIEVPCKSNIDSSIYLQKGDNIITVEWPIDSEKMLIYTHF